MTILNAKKALEDAMNKGISPTIEALDDLLEELDDFFTFVEDYDEWEMMYGETEEVDGVVLRTHEPGFSLGKLRVALGFKEDGSEPDN